jgi:hypothetical protein
MEPTRPTDGTERSRRWYLAPQPGDDASSHALRQAIGYIGFFLPIFLWILAGWRSVEGSPGWHTLDSISEYYYSGAVSLLTGALSVLAIFLWTYRGFENRRGRLDRILGKVAAVAALGVSFFPTTAFNPFIAPPWWAPWMRTVHYVAAAALFLSFICYSVFLFPQSSSPRQMAPDKRRRNALYIVCGLGMVVCVVWALFAGLQGGFIFWPESIALCLFGVSWLAKGRAIWTLKAVATQGPRRWFGARGLDIGHPPTG